MKTRLAIVLFTLLSSSAAFAERPDTTSPDFVAAAPARHVDRSLVASPDGNKRIDPQSVVPFELNSARLTEAGEAQVDTAARWLKKHKHMLVLEGHADAVGLATYNEDLATRRMVTVRERLIQRGVPARRIMLITFGEREAMSTANPLHGADRKVVMYATKLSPRAVAAVVAENRPAIVATWIERGAPMQVTHGLDAPPPAVQARAARRR